MPPQSAAGLRQVVRRIMFRARRTGATSRLVVRKTLGVRRTTFPAPQLATLRNFNRTNLLLRQARETLKRTRNTSNSSKS